MRFPRRFVWRLWQYAQRIIFKHEEKEKKKLTVSEINLFVKQAKAKKSHFQLPKLVRFEIRDCGHIGKQ